MRYGPSKIAQEQHPLVGVLDTLRVEYGFSQDEFSILLGKSVRWYETCLRRRHLHDQIRRIDNWFRIFGYHLRIVENGAGKEARSLRVAKLQQLRDAIPALLKSPHNKITRAQVERLLKETE